jgi:hypothetical protein
MRGSKPDRKWHRAKTERYVGLKHWLLDADACQALSPAAFKLLVYVWRRYSGSNNGRIPFAVREGEALGLHRDTTQRAFLELIRLGFLRETEGTSFAQKGRSRSGAARRWRLTAEPTENHGPTCDFLLSPSAAEAHGRADQNSFDGPSSRTLRPSSRTTPTNETTKSGQDFRNEGPSVRPDEHPAPLSVRLDEQYIDTRATAAEPAQAAPLAARPKRRPATASGGDGGPAGVGAGTPPSPSDHDAILAATRPEPAFCALPAADSAAIEPCRQAILRKIGKEPRS